jgi:type II secretory pathway component GspD/PulD (secretin)
MRKEVVKVNYIDAGELVNILNSYKSPRGRVQLQRNRNTLIIEDTPDFVDKLLSIIKELDVMPLDLMFTVDVILGSMKEEPGESIPGSDRLLKELKGLLKYKHFSRLDTTMIKIQDNGRSAQRMGGQGIGLMLELRPRHIKDGSQDGFQVALDLRQTTRRHERRDAQGNVEYFGSPLEKSLSLLHTTLSLKDGERSVVGVSKLNGGDTALILVIEGKAMK